MTQSIEEKRMPNRNSMAIAVEQAKSGVAHAITANRAWNSGSYTPIRKKALDQDMCPSALL